MTETQESDEDPEVSPQAEPAPTPLIPSSTVPLEKHRSVDLAQERRDAVEVKSVQIADTWMGPAESHIKGKLGEAAFLQYVGREGQLNTEVIADGGDGGVDVWLNGASVQIKTVGRRYTQCPELWVDAYSPFSADYYVLVSRVGPGSFRLVGYAPRWFVWNAPKRTHEGGVYRVVDREYLFPFPESDPRHL